MRAAFVSTVTELADRDPRILLLTGDLGYMALEPFAERFPGRFFNVGVAEQNMVGLATGLAEAGYVPFIYSIVTFASLRPYEFIRNGPILHRLPVRIVAVGGGFEYGPAGPTHHGLEDVGVMRVQPGLTIVCPADHEQTRSALLRTNHVPGPVYFRIGKDDRTTVPGLDGAFELGVAQAVRQGRDVLFIAMGAVASEAAGAVQELVRHGVDAGLIIVASVNPPPVEDLARALSAVPVVLTVEAHYVVGGLGSLVCEVMAERRLRCRIVRCGVRTSPDGLTGSQAYLHGIHGLSAEALVATALREMPA